MLRYVIEYIEVPPNPLGLDRIYADIALLDPVANNCDVDNRITLVGLDGKDRHLQLQLHKTDIIKCSRVMICDRNRDIQKGHIANTMFTDKDRGLYNTITVVDTSVGVPRTITASGDSGALVMALQDIAAHENVIVYGFVTGILTKTRRSNEAVERRKKSNREEEEDPFESFTIVNRLWDVLRYCEQVDNSEPVDFQRTP